MTESSNPPGGAPLGWTVREWVQAQREAASPDALVLAAWRAVGGAPSESPRTAGPQAGEPSAGGPPARDRGRSAAQPEGAWIELASLEQVVAQLADLETRLAAVGGDKARFPLFGVPCAVKDNIDVHGFDTTAACPAFTRPALVDSAVAERLRAAGAIFLGKTNLDQFATGLVGTRSPYGVARCEFDASRIGGGSSSGSAAVVSRGHVPFALGTDTAGSGRVPAAFQNIVGVKPSRGRYSTRGVVPACRTLDCVSVFALTVDDGVLLDGVLAGYDPDDDYSRRVPALGPKTDALRIGVPERLQFFGDELASEAFAAALEQVRALPLVGSIHEFDFQPFERLAALLYSEAWVAERALVAGGLLDEPNTMDPTVRGILLGAEKFSARDAFRAEYERARWARRIDRVFEELDVVLVPTVPTHFRVEEVLAEPLLTNARLGTYTNFTNLADLAAVALPGPFRSDGLPAGVTLLARSHHEATLFGLAESLARHLALPLGATGRVLAPASAAPSTRSQPRGVPLAVVGAHLSRMPLNPELTKRGARLLAETLTSPSYRLYLLNEPAPARPALRRLARGEVAEGRPICVEVWDVPSEQVGSFLLSVPPPLGLGRVELENGQWVQGFICEPIGLEGARDITEFGGFRAFVDAHR